MNLFMLGDFILSSGTKSNFKLECDALKPEDWDCIAYLLSVMVGKFHHVQGVPSGGLRIENAMRKYANPSPPPAGEDPVWLIVDDVLTTGGSMRRLMRQVPPGHVVAGAVLFARGPCPFWVNALLPLPECLWVKRCPPEEA